MKLAAIAGLLLALLLAVLLLGYVLHLARRRALATPAGAAPANDGVLAAAAGLLPAVRAAFAGRDEEGGPAYDAPLVLLAGEPASGQSAVLAMAGEGGATAGPLRWQRMRQGWLLAADTAYLGLDDQEGADAWQALAEALQRRRPRRPLDGVLLTIAADALHGPQALPAAELERRAALVQRRLGEMQALFGLRLPVYLLLTCADRLEGFNAFAAALPEGLRQAMLGWSSPYDPEQAYAPAWVAEGFRELGRTISGLQAEAAAAGARIDDPDRFFLLPGAVARLAEPAARYANALLADNAHHVAPMFRGIYLCGAPDASPAGEAPPWFAGDLLARKIFPERGLARPLGGQVLSRNKLVRRWAAACAGLVLLWGGALLWAHIDLRGKTARLQGTLALVREEQGQRDQLRAAGGGSVGYPWYQQSAQAMIDRMVDTPGGLAYLAIPASWHWSGQRLDERIATQFGTGLSNIVYRTLDKGLNKEAAKLSGAATDTVTTALLAKPACQVQPASEAAPLAPDVALADSAAFRQLAEFVGHAALFEQARLRLDRLLAEREGSYDDLVKVAAYTDAFDVPSQPPEGPGSLLQAALKRHYQPENAGAYRDAQAASLACAFRAQNARFLDETLERHPALAAARAIGQQLRSGNALGREGQLVPSLHSLGKWLKAPTLRWLADGDSGEGKAYSDLLHQVAGNTLLAGTVADARKQRAEKAAALEVALLHAEGGAGHAILQRGAEGRLEFTPELAKLASGLERLMQQPFMAEATPPLPEPSAAPGPLWDLKALNARLLAAEEARAYLDKEVRTFPLQFQAELKRYANQHLARNLVAEILDARHASANPAEVYERLGQAQKVLAALLDTLQALGADAEHAALAAALGEQASQGLLWLQRSALDDGLYRPRDGGFDWWQGTPGVGAQAFGNGEAQGVEEYLLAQQARVETSVRQAQPLLRLMEARDGNLAHPQARRWAVLGTELARFHDKQPGARMAQLHAYIRDLAASDGRQCQAAALPAGGGADFFSERQRALATALAARCRALARSAGDQGYLALRTQFRPLAGRFPFADAARPTEPAEVDDVLAYLQRYDQLGLDSTRMAPGRARDFVAANGAVRAFLAPLLPAAEGAPAAGYQLAVRFRVGAQGQADGNNALPGEVGGNRIAAWTLQSGDERISWSAGSRAAVQHLPWKPGMPLVLTLRWADNVAELPLDDGSDRYRQVQGRQVVYRFSEPWALLRLLARHRQPAAGARYETLRFDIPTGAAQARTSGQGARVFLRMAVLPAQQKEALAYPVFPTAAPDDASYAWVKP